MKHKTVRLLSALCVFALALSLVSVCAFADEVTVETAQEAALREIETLKKMGILSEKVHLEGDADDIYDSPKRAGDDYWFGRVFPHRYEVRWFITEDLEKNSSYGGNICVDAETGRLSHFSIDATPSADAEPVRESEWDGKTFYYYDNFEDIFSPDMTVDKFCTLLAEYWGFDGYTVSDTDDELYGKFEAVSGDTLLTELPSENVNYYLTVFFDGDQEGVPMYVQLCQFAGYVSLFVGTGHTVG